MSINASFIPLIQDLKAEYPDINQNVIVQIVHALNGFMPSIRVALDSKRNQRLRCSHHANPPKVHMPQFPRGRPASFPSFNQPLRIDVDESHLPNSFQMEAYTELGQRPPPPNYVNSVSQQNEGDYVQQQRQRLAYLRSEIAVSRRHLANAEAEIRCREQLMNQREFGSDQTFPSVNHINMLRQEVFRKRCELRTHIPINSQPFHDGAYARGQRPVVANSVSAPGTPDLPAYVGLPGQRQLSHPQGYSHMGGPSPQPMLYPPYPPLSPNPPPVPPHRSSSVRNAPPPPPFPPRVPPHRDCGTASPVSFHGSPRRPSDAASSSGPLSRGSSHRSSVEVVVSPPAMTSEEQEGARWNCRKCTFLNHPAMRVCEMCDTPKIIPQGI